MIAEVVTREFITCQQCRRLVLVHHQYDCKLWTLAHIA
jgi:hypothetical protein